MTTTITRRIENFKSDLLSKDLEEVIQRHITSGSCHILDENKYFDLKNIVATQFDVHPNEITMVGSGKLGFSIAPQKRFREFSDKSDIDIAVVSESIFDEIWKQAFEYFYDGGYWPQQQAFINYLFQGWIRPDKLPPAQHFKTARLWWDFFQALTSKRQFGPYKISAGLYRSWFFLERYQRICVAACKDALRLQ